MENYEIPEQPWKNYYQHFRFKLGRDSPSDARNTILVVATLIVAVTFQAGVNPPGGVWQDNSSRTAGKSILAANSRGYMIFVFFNTLAFSAATNAILWMVLGSPFQIEVIVAVVSMTATYVASVFAVTPPGISPLTYIYIALFLPYWLRLLSELIRRQRHRS